jgi:hypothetical protein
MSCENNVRISTVIYCVCTVDGFMGAKVDESVIQSAIIGVTMYFNDIKL